VNPPQRIVRPGRDLVPEFVLVQTAIAIRTWPEMPSTGDKPPTQGIAVLCERHGTTPPREW
jgi:hypothetical protein